MDLSCFWNICSSKSIKYKMQLPRIGICYTDIYRQIDEKALLILPIMLDNINLNWKGYNRIYKCIHQNSENVINGMGLKGWKSKW